MVADFHKRALVDAGVLVRALEFQKVVDVDAGGRGRGLLGRADHDTRRIDLVDDPRAPGDDRHAGIARDPFLHAGADERRLGADQRHRLALHVGSHQGAVGVVVLEERDQRRGDRNELLRRDVDQIDILRLAQDEIAVLAAIGQVGGDAAAPVEFDIGLADRVAALVHRRQIDDLVGHPAVRDLAVRALDKAVLVDPGIGRQAVDQADIRPFRGFDRADPAVMGRMHVTHLKAGALARQAARPQAPRAAAYG